MGKILRLKDKYKPLSNGLYFGKWCAYNVEVQMKNGETFNLSSNTGNRGLSNVIVTVDGNLITFEELDN